MNCDLNLDELFAERLEIFPGPTPHERSPADARNLATGNFNSKELNGAHGEDDAVREIINSLIQERDSLQAEIKDQANIIQILEQRHYNKDISQSDLPGDVVRRLNRLTVENERLRRSNEELKSDLKSAETENVNLYDENEGQAKKLKGANKKVKNAKDVAGKEEQKAKDAVLDKQRRLASERKMRKEKNDALAALEEQKKITEDLRAELAIERSGNPHIRENNVIGRNPTVVVPVHFEVRRGDFRQISSVLQSSQMTMTENLKLWYEEWNKVKEVDYEVVGMDDEDEDKTGRIFEDMGEPLDGLVQTGAEHDGRRSKAALEAICRSAEEQHNTRSQVE